MKTQKDFPPGSVIADTAGRHGIVVSDKERKQLNSVGSFRFEVNLEHVVWARWTDHTFSPLYAFVDQIELVKKAKQKYNIRELFK